MVNRRSSKTDRVAEYRTRDFQYDFPPEAIAQHPLEDRAASRLLVVDRRTGSMDDRHMRDLPSLLEAGDTLVVNTSRVIPARLKGHRDNGREAEVLVVHAEPDGSWLAMVHPGGKLKAGRTVRFGSDATATIVEVLRGGVRRIRFDGRMAPRELMSIYGETPLPPYIDRPPTAEDAERYQTVFATADGSIAAPTAGLHFTQELLNSIRDMGVSIAEVVLHIGPGTFKPVDAERLENHIMHAEWYALSESAAGTINAAKAAGHRVWAVGTTAVRTLETCTTDAEPHRVRPGRGWTDLFIYPPYMFKVVDAMVTNFHLPHSTLLMLVAAFGGYDITMEAYRAAVAAGYRLYSYGDAMAIL